MFLGSRAEGFRVKVSVTRVLPSTKVWGCNLRVEGVGAGREWARRLGGAHSGRKILLRPPAARPPPPTTAPQHPPRPPALALHLHGPACGLKRLGLRGSGVWGLGFGVWGGGWRVEGGRFGAKGFGIRVQGSGSRFGVKVEDLGEEVALEDGRRVQRDARQHPLRHKLPLPCITTRTRLKVEG